jgi:hypothetical protein
MFRGKGDGASGVISKLKDNYQNVRADLDKAAEITGLDRDEIKDIGYDIIDANPGDKMGYLARGGAKALLYSLEQGGKVNEGEEQPVAYQYGGGRVKAFKTAKKGMRFY